MLVSGVSFSWISLFLEPGAGTAGSRPSDGANVLDSLRVQSQYRLIRQIGRCGGLSHTQYVDVMSRQKKLPK